MKKIELAGKAGEGCFAIVDDCDYEWLNNYKWYSHVEGYAQTTVISSGKRIMILMHRMILGLISPKVYTDHINHNTLDNQRHNLRSCSRGQNQANSHKREYHYGKKTSSRFKGVSWNKACKKWVSRINIKGKPKYLGLFAYEDDAALAYDRAAKKNFGVFALTNESLGII